MINKKVRIFLALAVFLGIIIGANAFFTYRNNVNDQRPVVGLDLKNPSGQVGRFDTSFQNYAQQKGEPLTNIQGEKAPEPIYQRPTITEMLPILAEAEKEQKNNLFYTFFAPKKTVSEEQVFDKVWPKEYRESLRSIEDIMISDGYMTDTDRLPLATNDGIFKTLERILAYAHQKGWVADKDFKNFQKGLTETLPGLIQKEQDSLRGISGADTPVLPGGQNLSIKSDKKAVFADLMDGLKYVLMTAEPAYAGWHTSPDCYKDDMELGSPPGVNLWAFCCNCGLNCAKYCIFIYDCGPHSTSCNVPLGCLNLMCGSWPNAIWDAWWNINPTGICGCG